MILVISYEGEEHTASVVNLLRAQGREVIQIDLANFPARSDIALSWSNDSAAKYEVSTSDGVFDLSRANVGWWRRVRPFAAHAEITRRSDIAFVESETSQAVNGMLDALPCTWINPREADSIAHHKPYQWAVAQQVGLQVPRTLVTNNPAQARQFITQIAPGAVVFKAFLASTQDWRETRLVEASDIKQLELVKYAPVIFQEYIDGVDLRITVIGDAFFAAEIDARQTRYPVDMRMVVGEALVQPVTLSPDLQARLLALQRRLNLTYGAIDMRRTPAGDYYFLEVNPAGQWAFVEERTQLPITKAMADLLASLDHPI